MKSPQFSLRKWASTDDKNSSSDKENREEVEHLKENLSSQGSGKHFLSPLFLQKESDDINSFLTLLPTSFLKSKSFNSFDL